MSIDWRPPRPHDVDALLALVNGIEEADGNPWRTARAQLDHELGDLANPKQDAVAGFEPGGQAVALAWLLPSLGGARKWRAAFTPYVHPEHRDQRVADELITRIEARGVTRLRAAPGDLPRLLRSWAPADVPALRRLHERHGYEAQRFFSERRRSCTDPLPAAPLPAGVRLERWDPARSEDVRLAHNETFADHWGSEPQDEATWRRYHLESPDNRNDLSFVAWAGDEVAGYLLSESFPEDAAVTGFTEAWVATLGVPPVWRRRGIATAMLAAAVGAYREAGFEHASLAVDAGSETGALGLYDRLGFAEFYRSITYVKEL